MGVINMGADLDFKDGFVVVDYDYEHEFGKAGVHLKLDLVEILKKAAASTETNVDDKMVAMIEMALK